MKLKTRKSTLSKKNVIILFIFISFVLIGVGYSYIQSSLSINGNSTITGGLWKIYFDNLTISDGSLSTDNPAVISDDGTSISFSINFADPDEYYEFEVDVINDGLLDAMVSDYEQINISEEYKPYIVYEITYIDLNGVNPGDLLASKTAERIKFKFFFNKESDINNVPVEGSDKFVINIPYVQEYESAAY